jgi:hypothetical protein
MTASAIGTAFEGVLRKVGATAVHMDDDGDWFRFELDDRRFEAGLKRDAWLVTTPVGALKTDPSLIDKIVKAVRRANGKLPKGLRSGELAERDCYLHAEAKAPKVWLESDAELMAQRLEHTLAGARNLAQHAAVAKILGELGR